MMRKLSIVLSVVAALGLVVTAPAPADAKPKKKAVVVVGPKKKVIVIHKKKAGPTFIVGKTYNGNLYVGKKRHRWHNKWYAYGVGPCWIRVGDLWFWNIAACP